jgi:hypothetical protein
MEYTGDKLRNFSFRKRILIFLFTAGAEDFLQAIYKLCVLPLSRMDASFTPTFHVGRPSLVMNIQIFLITWVKFVILAHASNILVLFLLSKFGDLLDNLLGW